MIQPAAREGKLRVGKRSKAKVRTARLTVVEGKGFGKETDSDEDGSGVEELQKKIESAMSE